MPQDFDFSGIAKAETPPSYSFAGIEKVKQPTPAEKVTPENWRQAVGRGQVIFSNRVLTSARENAPYIGGTVGMAVGGPAGAAVGGATGAAVRDISKAAEGDTSGPTSATGAAVDVGGNAALQGLIGLANKAVTTGASWLAPRIMQSALKPGLDETVEAFKYGNVPPVVKKLLDDGIHVTRGGIAKLNDIIANAVPFSPEEAQAITARNSVARRLATIANEDPEHILKFVVQKSAAAQSMLARGFYEAASKASGVPSEVIRSAVAAVSSFAQPQASR